MSNELALPFLTAGHDRDLVEVSRHLDTASTDTRRIVADLGGAIGGPGTHDLFEAAAVGRKSINHGADIAVEAGTVIGDGGKSWKSFSKAPSLADIAAAERELADAKAKLAAVPDGQPTAALRERMQAPQQRVDTLRHDRRQAIEDLTRALDRLAGKLGGTPGEKDDQGGFNHAPGMPAAPGNGSAPPPVSSPHTAPHTDPSAAPPPRAQSAIDALMREQQRPGAPVQLPSQAAPRAAAPTAPAPAGRRDGDREPPLNIDELLAGAPAPGQPRSVPTAPVHAPAQSPAPAPTNSTGGSGATAANLTTAANTTGRNTNPAGAFDPLTTTSAARAADAATAPEAAAQRGAGMPAGQPGMPPLAGMPTPGSGGGGASREPVKRRDGAIAPGQEALDDAIPGGTILRRKPEDG